MHILKPLPGILPMPGHPLADAVGLWPMTSLGNKVFDLSGNNLTGTFGGDGVTWSSGPSGSVLDFAGSDDYVVTSATPGSYSKFTVIVKFLYRTIPNSEFGLFCWGENVANQPWFFLYGIATHLQMLFTDGASYNNENIPYTFTPNVWYTVAVTIDFDNQVYQWFVNGKYIGSDTSAATTYPMANEVINLGCRENHTTRELDGKLDYVHLIGRICTASEITLLYREPFCMFPENIMPEFGIAA